MPARPTRPALQERYDRRRQEMVFAAAKEFASRGYDQTTMQDLAASMGLATGALYHYFGGKEQLLIASAISSWSRCSSAPARSS